jgi:pantetheine-phosphate adenylyltransferase
VVRAVCPGSFDPVTYGHLDVIERSVGLFDAVIVAVGSNVAKNALFTPAERVEMLTQVCADWPGVTVTQFSGLLVDFCREQEVAVISKGLRSGDVEFELAMAQMNRHLTGVDTLLLPTDARWSYVSSSLVREVAGLGGDIEAFLPPAVAELTRRRVQERLSPS